MFGIGKNEEAEKTMEKAAKERAEDEIEFDFEEDDKLPFDDDEDFAEEEFEDEIESRGRSSRSAILLGLLLLLALGGGGYYYLNSAPTPPVQPPTPVAKIVKVQAESPVAPAPLATPVPTAAVVVSPVASRDVATPNAVVAVTPQPYTLAVGAFLDPKHQRSVEKKIRRLGYTPKVQTTYSMVPMTRLLLGVYDPAAAAVQRAELKAQIPDLFALKKGDKLALYAGSFQSLNSARSYADQLYLRGIHVDEETVSLRIPLKKVSYGAFSTRSAAEKAAQKAAAAGLSAQVIKH